MCLLRIKLITLCKKKLSTKTYSTFLIKLIYSNFYPTYYIVFCRPSHFKHLLFFQLFIIIILFLTFFFIFQCLLFSHNSFQQFFFSKFNFLQYFNNSFSSHIIFQILTFLFPWPVKRQNDSHTENISFTIYQNHTLSFMSTHETYSPGKQSLFVKLPLKSTKYIYIFFL